MATLVLDNTGPTQITTPDALDVQYLSENYEANTDTG